MTRVLRLNALAVLGLVASWPAAADLYRCMDRNGQVNYSITPPAGPCFAAVGGGDRPGVRRETKPIAAPSKSPGDFPRVDVATQKARDVDRRRILEAELAEESRLMAEAQRQGIGDLMAHHGRNVAALEREISYVR